MDGGVTPVLGPKVFFPLVLKPLFSGGQAPDAETEAIAKKTFEEDAAPLFDYLEKQLGDREYFVGNPLTIADISVAAELVNTRHAGFAPARKKFPKLRAFLERMWSRPTLKMLIDEETPVSASAPRGSPTDGSRGGASRLRPARDAAAVRACFVALQDFEHALDPAAPCGDAIADAYLDRMFSRCTTWAGRVFVAEVDGAVAGFVCVWGRVPPQEPDEPQADYAYVSDLVVLARWRRRGSAARCCSAPSRMRARSAWAPSASA